MRQNNRQSDGIAPFSVIFMVSTNVKNGKTSPPKLKIQLAPTMQVLSYV
jgi:hypothetical protein